MADTKISALTSATIPLAGTEVVPLVQSGTTKNVSIDNLTTGRAVSVDSLTATGYSGINAVSASLASLKAESTTAGVNAQFVAKSTAREWRMGTNMYLSDNSYEVSDVTGGGNRLAIDTSGNVKIAIGNLVQGTAAKGINFTANTPAAGMTSQLLNAYEEGTFDPRLSFASGGDTCSYAGRTGRYTRIGRLVTVNIYVGLTAKGAGTGNVSLINLPFTAGSYSSAVPRVISMTSTGTVSAYIYSGQSAFSFFSVNTSGTETQLTDTNITNSTEIILTLSYIV